MKNNPPLNDTRKYPRAFTSSISHHYEYLKNGRRGRDEREKREKEKKRGGVAPSRDHKRRLNSNFSIFFYKKFKSAKIHSISQFYIL
jgi:hypothetical protein